MSVATRLVGSHHAMGLVMGRTQTTVRLAGKIDAAAVDDLSATLEGLESVSMPMTIDLIDVTSLDCDGVQPLIETTRRRERAGHGPLWVGIRSRQVQLFLDATGLDGSPHLDVAVWDQVIGRF